MLKGKITTASGLHIEIEAATPDELGKVIGALEGTNETKTGGQEVVQIRQAPIANAFKKDTKGKKRIINQRGHYNMWTIHDIKVVGEAVLEVLSSKQKVARSAYLDAAVGAIRLNGDLKTRDSHSIRLKAWEVFTYIKNGDKAKSIPEITKTALNIIAKNHATGSPVPIRIASTNYLAPEEA